PSVFTVHLSAVCLSVCISRLSVCIFWLSVCISRLSVCLHLSAVCLSVCLSVSLHLSSHSLYPSKRQVTCDPPGEAAFWVKHSEFGFSLCPSPTLPLYHSP